MMNVKTLENKIKWIFIILFFFPMVLFAQNEKALLADVQFEHIRINVADKESTAKWYVENVGLKIIPSNNKDFIYVTDKDENFMIELSSIPGLRTKYFDIHLDAFHLAFEGHKTINAVAEKMIANGGIQEGVLYTNKIGDYVMNIRDPNGFNTQLLHRVNPFFPKPVKSTIRFEHFAFNTPDQKVTALWFVEFMGLKIPWSKDIDTLNNNFRNYRVPYVGDAGRNMSMELFGKKDIDITLAKMKHEECHLAFLTNEPEKLTKLMVYGGAKIITPAKVQLNGDVIVDLVDPSNFPIRLIKRKKSILTKK
jgi:catechol 2,3-dioxygenase-like lactoylglutathione lyase family enzyme